MQEAKIAYMFTFRLPNFISTRFVACCLKKCFFRGYEVPVKLFDTLAATPPYWHLSRAMCWLADGPLKSLVARHSKAKAGVQMGVQVDF